MRLLSHVVTGHSIAVNYDAENIVGYEEGIPYPTEEEIAAPEFQRLWKVLQYTSIECDEVGDHVVPCTYNHIKLFLEQMNED